MRKIGFVLAIIILFPAVPAYAQDSLYLISPSAILMEQTTGKVLYAKNERARMYPASMTKILTSLVVLDHLHLDDIVVVGPEIRTMPAGYNTAIHFEGEYITVRNLLRALMVRSGNETGHVLALNVIRARDGRQNITYEEAERSFNALMNEKARSLGAMESHFNNPYGFQSENHYTTAYDMALISRAFMEIEELRDVVAIRQFSGDGLDGRVVEGAQIRHYEWTNHNEMLRGGAHAYPYATGIKTGFTDAAGFCLAASATKMGFSLISVVFFAPEPAARFQDTRVLMDYGFFTYAMLPLQARNDYLDTVIIANPRLGEGDELDILAGDTAESLLSQAQHTRVRRVIAYDETYLYEFGEDEEAPADGRTRIKAPLEKGTPLGKVQYILDGEILFEGAVIAAADVLERSFDSDMDYHIAQFKENVFTRKGIPYWFGVIGTLTGIIGIAAAVNTSRKSRNRNAFPRYRGYR
jgi:D-alanyl-D-alanine carboxypeptidase (penicillin-binding protein 5/6)